MLTDNKTLVAYSIISAKANRLAVGADLVYDTDLEEKQSIINSRINTNVTSLDSRIAALENAVPDVDLSSYYQKPQSGIPRSDLNNTVKESLNKANAAALTLEYFREPGTTSQLNSIANIKFGTIAFDKTKSELMQYKNNSWRSVDSLGFDVLGTSEDIPSVDDNSVSYSQQTNKTPEQQAQARLNIGAVSSLQLQDAISSISGEGGGSYTLPIDTQWVTNSTNAIESRLIATRFGSIESTLSEKADKNTTVSNIEYANGNIQKTVNGQTTDLVSVDNIFSYADSSMLEFTNSDQYDDLAYTAGGNNIEECIVNLDHGILEKQNALQSGINIKTINNQSLVGSGNINIATLPDLQLQSGVLISEDGQVSLDSNSYTRYLGSVANYYDLPTGDSSIKTGDMYFVEEFNSFVVAKNVELNSNLYVSLLSKNDQRVLYTLAIGTTHQPVTESAFIASLKSSRLNDFLAYPSITSAEFHKQSANDLFNYAFWDEDSQDAFFRIVPVKIDNKNRFVIALVAENTSKTRGGVKKAFVASKQNGGELNTWYINNYGLTNTGEVIEIDILNSDSLPVDGQGTDKQKRYFYTFGGGVKWTKPTEISTTINNIPVSSNTNITITPSNSLRSATNGEINSLIIDSNTSYDNVKYMIDCGFTPIFKDSNGYCFPLWRDTSGSGLSSAGCKFANWISSEQTNTLVFRIWSIEEGEDTQWSSTTISLT